MANDTPMVDNLALQLMSQQQLAHSSTEDWTGVTDPAQRRKLQNRLNQRTYRSRRQATSGQDEPKPEKSVAHVDQQPAREWNGALDQPASRIPQFRCGMAPEGASQLMILFERLALESHRQGSPNLDHLITLSRVNVQRAVMENILAVGMTMEWMTEDDAISLFNMPSPQIATDQIPLSLRPTVTQRSTPHHPWLDVFPFPNMRDNLITASEDFDDEELCRDLMGFWDTHDSRATLLVWGSPYDPRNWEVTPGFLAKWGWLLRGCPELLVSTNKWRVQRGEKALFRKGTPL